MKNPLTTASAVLLFCLAAYAQHDVHRNSVRLVAKGQYEAAVKALAKIPDDPESLFLMAMIHSLQGDPEQALTYARRAVDAGLPFGRFLAGPREAFAALTASEGFKAWAAQHKVKLVHGPLLGSVTHTSARFWLRTAGEATVAVEAKPAARSAEIRTSQARDYVAIIKAGDLSPSTTYEYSVLVDGQRVTDTPLRFRTYPPPVSKATFAVGFGGGAGYLPKRERMWLTVAERKPLAFLMLGDNVYIDDPTHPLTHRYCYYRRQSRPEWLRFVASTSIYAIYDDHDFGMNDCVPGPEIEAPPWKRSVWRIFKENWANPAYGGGEKQPGCWHDFYIADVHFILLDGRYYRDLKGGSMLGPVQKTWLFETLKASKGTFKVIASPVPWSEGVKPRSRDTWDGFPQEREEIFSFLEQNRIDGVVLISADRHRSDIRKTTRPDGYDLVEFESSRLTNRHTHGIVKTPGLVFGYNKKCSFGLLRFDTTKDDPEVTFEIVNIDGEQIHTSELKQSQLSHSRGRKQ